MISLDANCSLSAPRDHAAWAALTRRAVLDGMRKSKKSRGGASLATRRERNAPWCDGKGVDCHFLERGSRHLLPAMLEKMGYRGASAEVGVWLGDYSAVLLRSWPSGGVHLAIDPFEVYDEGCKRKGWVTTGQWHCTKTQQRMNEVFGNTSRRLAWGGKTLRNPAAAKRRATMLRNHSLDVAAALARSAARLDFAYLDGRHDYAGVVQDLAAWWPRICPGGALAGHDYTDEAVARAVGEFFAESGTGGGGACGAAGRSDAGCAARRPVVFVTAESPASYLVFKPPARPVH